MSSLGFPDWQEIQQWFGSPIAQQTARAIGAGSVTEGPFVLSSWASIIVAIKPTGGAVTVTITQAIDGAPAALTTSEVINVPAGSVAFIARVLFGNVLSVTVTGTVPGTTADYSLYPSNTTTNAQVITAATINVQHNEVLVAAEPTIDLVDANGQTWGVTDDAGNTRVKLTPPRQGTRQNGLAQAVNTVAQISLANLVLPAGAMGANGIVHVRMIGAYINASGAPSNLNIEIDFGGGFGWSNTFPVAMESAAFWRPVIIDFDIANQGAVNSQFIAGTIHIGDHNGVPANGWGNGARPQNDANVFARTFPFSSAGPVAINTALAQTIGIYFQHGTASPSIEARSYASIAEVL